MKKYGCLSLLLLALFFAYLFFFVPFGESRRTYSPDGQYSVYASTYIYDAFIPRMPGGGSDKEAVVYLYDEIEKKVINKGHVAMLWLTPEIEWDKEVAYYKGEDVPNAAEPWELPRPISVYGQLCKEEQRPLDFMRPYTNDAANPSNNPSLLHSYVPVYCYPDTNSKVINKPYYKQGVTIFKEGMNEGEKWYEIEYGYYDTKGYVRADQVASHLFWAKNYLTEHGRDKFLIGKARNKEPFIAIYKDQPMHENEQKDSLFLPITHPFYNAFHQKQVVLKQVTALLQIDQYLPPKDPSYARTFVINQVDHSLSTLITLEDNERIFLPVKIEGYEPILLENGVVEKGVSYETYQQQAFKLPKKNIQPIREIIVVEKTNGTKIFYHWNGEQLKELKQ